MIGHNQGPFHSWPKRDTVLRAMAVVSLCLVAILATGSIACGEALGEDGTLFARPINGWDNGNGGQVLLLDFTLSR